MRGFGQRDHVFPRMHDAAVLSVLSEPFQKYLATRMPAARGTNDLYRLVGRIVLREELTAAAVRTFRFFPHGESPNPRRPSGQPLMREIPISGPDGRRGFGDSPWGKKRNVRTAAAVSSSLS